MDERTLSERLGEAIGAAWLTPAQAAERLGIPRKEMMSWLNEESTPPEYVQTFVFNALADIAKEREREWEAVSGENNSEEPPNAPRTMSNDEWVTRQRDNQQFIKKLWIWSEIAAGILGLVCLILMYATT